jgi:hypothetical protein
MLTLIVAALEVIKLQKQVLKPGVKALAANNPIFTFQVLKAMSHLSKPGAPAFRA